MKLLVIHFVKIFLKVFMERVKGIEPSLFAWEAKVLPLNDTRESE